MASSRVLKVPRSDDPDAYVLVNVSQKGKAGLDLRLAATEGENPYITTIKEKKIKDIRSKNYKGTDAEWTQILRFVLSPTTNGEPDPDLMRGVEVVASISGKEDQQTLTILLRKRIEDITQRLGSITLEQNDEEPIELYAWCGQALDQTKNLNDDADSLKAKYQSSSDTINKLQAQLEDLVKAKREHEEELTAQFALLLNDKKKKIRNQQRILVSAKVDPKLAKAVKKAAAEGKGRQAASSRQLKRKTGPQAETSDSSDDFEKMDVDTRKSHALNEDEQQDSGQEATPSVTEDEDDDNNEGLPLHTRSRQATPEGAEGRRAKGMPQTSTPPAPRELPFAKRTAGRGKEPEKAKSPIPEPADGEDAETEGETDDDEL